MLPSSVFRESFVGSTAFRQYLFFEPCFNSPSCKRFNFWTSEIVPASLGAGSALKFGLLKYSRSTWRSRWCKMYFSQVFSNAKKNLAPQFVALGVKKWIIARRKWKYNGSPNKILISNQMILSGRRRHASPNQGFLRIYVFFSHRFRSYLRSFCYPLLLYIFWLHKKRSLSTL